MFEKIVEAILVEYLSEWIEGLDAENMKIGIFSGKIECKDLKVKASAMEKLQLPINIIEGSVGRLSIKVPWKRLRERAVKIVLEDVYILVRPAQGDSLARGDGSMEVDDKTDLYEVRQRWAKSQEICVRELLEKAKAEQNNRDVAGETPSDSTTAWGFRDKIMRNVLDNISLDIQRVHMQFEDNTTLMSHSKCVSILGCTTDSIKIHTTNANGIVAFVDRSQSRTPFLHKRLDIENFGIYCMSSPRTQSNIDIRTCLDSGSKIWRSSPAFMETYVIQPFKSSIQLIRYDDRTSECVPRYQFVADISSINASLSPSQCNQIICALSFISSHETYLKQLHISRKRPPRPVCQQAKAWWKYAFYGVKVMYGIKSSPDKAKKTMTQLQSVHIYRPNCSWETLTKLWMARGEYIALKIKMLRSVLKKAPTDAVLSDRLRLNTLEDELDVDTIVFFRLCARKEFEMEESRQGSISKLSNWRTRWKHKSEGVKDENKKSAKKLLSSQQLDFGERFYIYVSVAEQIRESKYSEAQSDTEEGRNFSLDIVVASLQVTLVSHSGSCSVVGDTEKKLPEDYVRLQFQQFSFALFQQTDGCRIVTSIGEIVMLDSSIIGDSPSAITISQPLFYSLPVDSVDQKVKFLNARIDSSDTQFTLVCSIIPFRFIVNFSVFTKLTSYFFSEVEEAVPTLKENAGEVLAYSSSWINNTIFAANFLETIPQSPSCSDEGIHTFKKRRFFELSVNLPSMEILLLSGMTSPIFQINLTNVCFNKGAIIDAFVFKIEAEGLFLEHAEDDVTDVSANECDITEPSLITDRILQLKSRNCSTILNRTLFELSASMERRVRKHHKWTVKCSSPPVFVMVSQQQYQQVLQTSAQWNRSIHANTTHHVVGGSAATTHRDASIGSNKERRISVERTCSFVPEEELFSITFTIPRIIIVLQENSDIMDTADTYEKNHRREGAIDVVLVIQQISMDARFTSSAQAVVTELRRIILRRFLHDEALLLRDIEDEVMLDNILHSIDLPPRFQMHSNCHRSAAKTISRDSRFIVLDLQQKATFIITDFRPLKVLVRVKQLGLHWDQKLMCAFFGSFLDTRSPTKKASSLNKKSDAIQDTRMDVKANGTEFTLFPCSIEILIDRCYIMSLPLRTASEGFRLHLAGQQVRFEVSTLGGSYTVLNMATNSGMTLDASRSRALDPNDAETEDSTQECINLVQMETISATLEIPQRSSLLLHRANAPIYYGITIRKVEAQYMQAHFSVVYNFISCHIFSFIDWMGSHGEAPVRTATQTSSQLEASISSICISLPREAELLSMTCAEQKKDSLQIDLGHAHITWGTNRDLSLAEKYIFEIAYAHVSSKMGRLCAVSKSFEEGNFGTGDENSGHDTESHITTTIFKLPRIAIEYLSCLPDEALHENLISSIRISIPPLTKFPGHEEESHCQNEKEELGSDFTDDSSMQLWKEYHEEHYEGGGSDDEHDFEVYVGKSQVELALCIIEENFAQKELIMDAIEVHLSEMEHLCKKMEFEFGDTRIRFLGVHSASSSILENEILAELDLSDFKVSSEAFSGQRTQYRFTCSNAQLWLIESSSLEDFSLDHDVEPTISKTRQSHSGAEIKIFLCTDLYISSCDLETTFHAFDMTLNVPPNMPQNEATLSAQIHINTLAATSAFLNLWTVFAKALACKSRYPNYSPDSSMPIEVSATVGNVQILLSAIAMTEENASLESNETKDEDISEGIRHLYLVLSGCLVLRYNTKDSRYDSIQAFGRDFSIELATKWNLTDDTSVMSQGLNEDSPCERRSSSTFGNDTSPEAITDLHSAKRERRNRVICDDFSFDIDIVDASKCNNLIRLSLSLSNFHAVVCAYDIWPLHRMISSKSTTLPEARSSAKQCIIICTNVTLEDISITYVREIENYLSPLARIYVRAVQCSSSLELGGATLNSVASDEMAGREGNSIPEDRLEGKDSSPSILNFLVYFAEGQEEIVELQEDEGLSIWVFNTCLGAWDPLVEPWMFMLSLRYESGMAMECQKIGCIGASAQTRSTIAISLEGTLMHALKVNFSPFILDTLCIIIQEYEQIFFCLKSTDTIDWNIAAPTARVISSGCFLENDCGIPLKFFVNDHSSNTLHTRKRSRGFTNERIPYHDASTSRKVFPGQKLPLNLSTTISPFASSDQTLTLLWGEDEEFHATPNVRIHKLGSSIYNVVRKEQYFRSEAEVKTNFQCLTECYSSNGHKTMVVTSTIRLYNDTDKALLIALASVDTRKILEIGEVKALDTLGVPIDLIKDIASLRLVLRPAPDACSSERKESARNIRQYRWSNELFIKCESNTVTEGSGSCPIVQTEYSCQCQRILTASQPLHTSEICQSNGCYFKFTCQTSSTTQLSTFSYARIHIHPPLKFENECDTAIHIVFFVLKLPRGSGGSDRENFHMICSQTIEAHGNLSSMAASLQEKVYCSISMTGFSWSKLFLVSDIASENASRSSSAAFNAATNMLAAPLALFQSSMSADNADTASTPSCLDIAQEIICEMKDFQMRQATLKVTQPPHIMRTNSVRRVIIQPSFIIQNQTQNLQLSFSPCVASKLQSPRVTASNLSKSFFGMTSSAIKFPSKLSVFPRQDHGEKSPPVDEICCSSPFLEKLHQKLNAFDVPSQSTTKHCQGATTVVSHNDWYVSNTDTICIQIEGSTQNPSAASYVRLGASTSSSHRALRLYDESCRQWRDLSISLSQINTWGTTNVTFSERYVFVNSTDHTFLCCPADTLQRKSENTGCHSIFDKGIIFPSQQSTPFHWVEESIPSDYTVRLLKLSSEEDAQPSAIDWRWSGKFSVHDVGEVALKVSSASSDCLFVIRVNVRVESLDRILVILTSEDGQRYPLYRFINSTEHAVITVEQSPQQIMSNGIGHGVRQTLSSGQILCFGWDEIDNRKGIAQSVLLCFSACGYFSAQVELSIDRSSEMHKIALEKSDGEASSMIIYLFWYLNGITKTLHVHDEILSHKQLLGSRFSKLTSSEVPNLKDDTANDDEARLSTSSDRFEIQIQFPLLMVSLIDKESHEVLLASFENIIIDFARQADDNDQLEVKIGFFQMDNQLENAVLPVLFTPLPVDSARGVPHGVESPRKVSIHSLVTTQSEAGQQSQDAVFFHASLLKLYHGEDLFYIKYFSAMMQPASVQLDDYLLLSIIELISEATECVHRNFPQVQRTKSTSDHSSPFDTVSSDLSVEKCIFVETMQLHPLKLQITFQQNNLAGTSALGIASAALKNKAAELVVLPLLFLILKANIVNIDAAPLHLNALHVEHYFATRTCMLATLRRHYKYQGMVQIYSLVGAADILGNPVGLVINLGTGVKDFFYEPVAGMVKSPQDFMLGLSRGTASLVKNSVYGTFNAASKFTGTLSSGIAALSMDRQYISSRNSRNRREVATHLGTGLFYGTKQLGLGILEGVSGVLTAPAMGAYTNGFGGFVEGIGKGIIGAAVKPTAGILDLAACATAGITATATVFDKKPRKTRMRLPRLMHRNDQRLHVYSSQEAWISSFVYRLISSNKLTKMDALYESHVLLPMQRIFIVCSSCCMLVVLENGNPLTIANAIGAFIPRLEWKVSIDSIYGAENVSKGVNILLKASAEPAGNAPWTSKKMATAILIPILKSDYYVADALVKCICTAVSTREREHKMCDTIGTS